jgi:hypothetical protein
MSSGMSRRSTLRQKAPRILMVAGIGVIGLGAAMEYFVPGSPLMERLGLSGTVFGLASKMGGALFFGGLFAMAAAAGRPAQAAQRQAGATPAAENNATATALRAARIARERRAQAQAQA